MSLGRKLWCVVKQLGGGIGRLWTELMQDGENVVNGWEDLWDEYSRLHKEVKQLVIKKKLNIYLE